MNLNKICEIECCDDCVFVLLRQCWHPDILKKNNGTGKEISDGDDIAAFCPLPNARDITKTPDALLMRFHKMEKDYNITSGYESSSLCADVVKYFAEKK
jgi:hypothetical protein